MIEKIKTKEAVIGVVGLGYVGLPLVLCYAGKGFKVIGFDIDEHKVQCLKEGKSYIKHIDVDPLVDAVNSGLLDSTSDFSRINEVDAIIMCVPTPLDEHYEPDLSYVINTVESIVPFMRSGQIISLESTTYPGTTEEEIRPRIEARGFEIGKDVFLVYSPEREDPGNPDFSSKNIPKVVGGSTPECSRHGNALYEAGVESIVPVESTQIAEFTKLLENIYRSVNIGLVNELKVAADRMNIDIWKVIDAAATKPFGFKAFYPGPGLGGHCIPIDPFYLTWKAREYGFHTRFIELAGEINRSMPEYVVGQTSEALNDVRKPLNGSKVLLMGLSYKEDVDDMRESPTFELLDLFSKRGSEVDYFDPHIPEIGPTREHRQWRGKKSVEWNEQVISAYDVVVIVTNHRVFDLQQLIDWAQLIVDTRNAIDKRGLEYDPDKISKA